MGIAYDVEVKENTRGLEDVNIVQEDKDILLNDLPRLSLC